MLNIFAPINNLGYGIHANNMIKALRNNDVKLSLNVIGQVQPNDYYKLNLEELHGNYSLFDSSAPSLHIFHDEYVTSVGGKYPIAFSVFETTELNDHVVYNLKNVAEKVFTTTEKHKEILQLNGINPDKIHVINEGVDGELYNADPCNKYVDTGKFTYITVGKKEERKNTDMIIRTFIENMQYMETALICHTFNPFSKPGDGGQVTTTQFTDVDLEKYGFKKTQVHSTHMVYSNGMCDVYFTYPIQDQTKMRNLYRSANVGIAVSRAEGWDLPLIELLACGVPTIASDVIGHSEYLPGAPSVQQSLIVQPRCMEVADDGVWFHGDRGLWAKIDSEDLIDMLEMTWDDQDKYKDVSQELSKYYIDNYSWDKPALKIKELLTL